jgi:hypothetical protein
VRSARVEASFGMVAALCLVANLASFAHGTPAHAGPSNVSSQAYPVFDSVGPAVVHRRAPVLFHYYCGQCAGGAAPSQLPQVQVFSRGQGDEEVELPGTTALLVPSAPSGYFSWTSDEPLKDGRYVVRVRHDGDALFRPRETEFEVRGEPSDMPHFESRWTLTRTEGYRDGTPASCLVTCVKACGEPGGGTRIRARALVTVQPESDGREHLANEYLLRAVGLDGESAEASEPGTWQSVFVSLQHEFQQAQPEYCVQLQALRIRDGAILSVTTECLHDERTASLDSAPADFDHTCKVNGELEEYREAWCRDNAQSCLGPKALDYGACNGYGAHCAAEIANDEGKKAVEQDGSSPSAEMMEGPLGQGGAPGAAGCAVSGSGSTSAPAAFHGLLAALLLQRWQRTRRIGTGSRRGSRSPP